MPPNTAIMSNSKRWDTTFELLLEFKKAHGHCNVSRHDTACKALGQWVNQQRAKYTRKQRGETTSLLTLEQEIKLETLGFQWHVGQGNYHRIGVGASNKKSQKKLDKLEARQQVQELSAIGIVNEKGKMIVTKNIKSSEPKSPPNQGMDVLLPKSPPNPGMDVLLPKSPPNPGMDVLLEAALSAKPCNDIVSPEAAGITLTDEETSSSLLQKRADATAAAISAVVANPTDIPINEPELADQEIWESYFRQLLGFKTLFGHCYPSEENGHCYPSEEYGRLRCWCDKQRAGTGLPPSQQGKLSAIGFWEPKGAAKAPKTRKPPFLNAPKKAKKQVSQSRQVLEHWDAGYENLVFYQQAYGHCIVPTHYGPLKDLGLFVRQQRLEYIAKIQEQEESSTIKSKLTDEQFELLKEINLLGVDLDSTLVERSFMEQQCQGQAPQGNEKRITTGQLAVVKLRQEIRRDDCLQKMIKSQHPDPLELLPDMEKWKAYFEGLLDFHQNHGHFCVRDPKCRLGRWIAQQRNIYKYYIKSTECCSAYAGFNAGPNWVQQEAKLTVNGFEWTDEAMIILRKPLSWEDGYQALRSYQEGEGGGLPDLPFDHHNKDLIDWVTMQRVYHARKNRGIKTSELDDLREAKLDAIGFCWKPETDLEWMTAIYLHDYDDNEDDSEDEEESAAAEKKLPYDDKMPARENKKQDKRNQEILLTAAVKRKRPVEEDTANATTANIVDLEDIAALPPKRQRQQEDDDDENCDDGDDGEPPILVIQAQKKRALNLQAIIAPESESECSIVCLTEEEERVNVIATWLTNVIGYAPIFEEMQAYARIFYNLGMHSVECILNEMQEGDLDLKEFESIKHFHKTKIGEVL